MKRLIAIVTAVFITAGMAWAVPSFTPVIDGVKDAGWGDTPDHTSTTLLEPVTFNLDSGMYVTDDGLNIYFGFWADNDPWPDGKSVHVHIVMDIGSTADGGTYACWGANQVTYGFPFKPEYDIVAQWNTGDQNISYTGLQRWQAGNWIETEITTDGGGGNQWTEIAVLKANVGFPAQGTVLNLSMWLRPTWDKTGSNCCLPADEDFPSMWADAAGTFNSQFAYTLQAALSDTDPPGISSVHQIDRTGFEIAFDEPMDTSTFIAANFTPTGWIFTGFRYKTLQTVGISVAPPGFVMGTTYSVVVGSGVTDYIGNAMDPADDSASWTGAGYSDVTFLCIDESEIHDSIQFKGSFNFYHEYDGSWSGGRHWMYDDGTNGDAVANDHTFTRIFLLVPNGGTPNFEWGVMDERGDAGWLVVGSNPNFSLPDTNDIVVSYTIPDVTNSAVNVTFTVDMQFIPAIVDSMLLAGSFTNWGTSPLTMTNNGDSTYSITVTFAAGSQRTNYFKFIRVEGANFDWENFADNRTFDINDSQPTQDLGLMFFNNYFPAPYNVTAIAVAGGVDIQWNDNWRRVTFEVYGSANLDAIVDPGNLLGTVPAGTGNHYLDPIATDKKFYQVRMIHPTP